MKNQMKEKKGITLIALVITIIVLLILAGVTIATLTGDNGLLTKAGETKKTTEESDLREEISLKLLQTRMGDSLEDLFGEQNVETDGPIYKLTYKGKEFLLDNNYEFLEKVEPAFDGEWTFDQRRQLLTAYNGNLETKRGNQEPGEIIIPNYYNGKRVKIIDQNIFKQNDKLTKLTISYGIEKINALAFYYCNQLKGDITIPDSVIEIEQRAFEGCSSLDGKLKLSDKLEIISTDVFKGCNFKGDLTIPNNVKIIAWGAFNGLSSLDGKLTLGNNIQKIGYGAFSDCSNLTGDLILPDTLTQLDNYAFSNCSSLNGKIKISNALETIPGYAFYNCSGLTGDLIIPDSVVTIEQVAFNKCSGFNGKLKLGTNLEKIDVYAFAGCSNLKGDIVFGSKVTTVGYVCFQECGKFSSAKFLNPSTTIDARSFLSVEKIIGYADSTAQTYATNKNITFEPIRP